MKIFFLASIASKPELKETYKQIIESLFEKKCKVIYEHVFEDVTYVRNLPTYKVRNRAKLLYKQMLECEAIVYEGTHSSTGAGFLLSNALNKNIPVLFLTQDTYSGFYLTDPNKLLQVKSYQVEHKNNLTKIIKNFLKFAEKKRLSNRFNLMISDSMKEYISEQSKSLNISKASYLRNLVYEKMQTNDIEE